MTINYLWDFFSLKEFEDYEFQKHDDSFDSDKSHFFITIEVKKISEKSHAVCVKFDVVDVAKYVKTEKFFFAESLMFVKMFS